MSHAALLAAVLEAQGAGARAHADGVPLTDNPYSPSNDVQRRHWRRARRQAYLAAEQEARPTPTTEEEAP